MRTDRVCYDLLSIRLFPIVDAYIQENARDINLYLEFNSMDDISTIINQLKAQNVQIYDIDIERNRSGEQLHPSSIFSIRLNEKNTAYAAAVRTGRAGLPVRDRRAVTGGRQYVICF